MASRLEYEMSPIDVDTGGHGPGISASELKGRFGPPPPDTPAWTVLNAADDRLARWSSRLWTLRTIHASTVEQFDSAPGFGITRMSMVGGYPFMDRRESAKSLPGAADHYPATIQEGPLRAARVPPQSPQSNDAARVLMNSGKKLTAADRFESCLWSVHEAGRRDFVAPEDTGLIIDRDHVAGFVPHQFSEDFDRRSETNLILQRLQLVSLRRFGHPMVYVTNKELPRMENIEKVPTRELNAFEAAALESLAKGEELCYAQHGRSMLALGALRARDECTKCHEAERGSLLGAFSYEFLGDAPPAKSAKPPI
jgi:hypothetical protein